MLKNYKDIDFSSFNWRDDKLSRIYRWNCVNDFVYRSNDLYHSHKVFCLISQAISENLDFFEKNNYDIEKIQIMALIHDDIEIIIWDFQAYKKDIISKERLQEKENSEKNAVNTLGDSFPKMIWKYVYKDLLEEMESKKTFESQFVKYFDHIDWMCERLHECYGNNEFLLDIPLDDEGIKLPWWQRHYWPKISNPEKNYPLIYDYLNQIWFHYNVDLYDEKEIITKWKRHTKESLWISKWHNIYDWRIKSLIKWLNNDDLELLLVESKLRFCDSNNYILCDLSNN